MIVASQLQPTEAIYREVIPAGDYWMYVVKKDQVLRILGPKLFPWTAAGGRRSSGTLDGLGRLVAKVHANVGCKPAPFPGNKPGVIDLESPGKIALVSERQNPDATAA